MSFDDTIGQFYQGGDDEQGTDFGDVDVSYADLLEEMDTASTRKIERYRSRPKGIGKKLEESPRGLVVRLFPGAYPIPTKEGGTKTSFSVPFGQHWINGIKRYVDCLDDKCVVCYYLKRRAIRDVTTSLRQMITVFSTDTWHLEDVPYTNKYGESGSYTERYVCEGPGCAHCSDGLKKQAGWWTIWHMPLAHYKSLLGHLAQIASSCQKCQERVYPLILMCGQGDCSFAIDTVKNKLKQQDVNHYIKTPTTCPSCGTRRKMMEHLGCFDDSNRLTGCTDSSRTDPFNVNIRFNVTKDAKAAFSSLHMVKHSSPGPIDFANDFPDWPKDKVGPMRLLGYRHTISPEVQAELIGMRNPFSNIQEI